MRISFEGESLGAMSPGLITVSRELLSRKLQLVPKKEERGEEGPRVLGGGSLGGKLEAGPTNACI